MYAVFNTNHIHHLLNEAKILNFAYNNDVIRYFQKKKSDFPQ